MAARIAYTQYKRRNNPPVLSAASNAVPNHDMVEAATTVHLEDEKNLTGITIAEKGSSVWTSEISLASNISQIALFPQYITKDPTTITIREVDFPHFKDSFLVTLPSGEDLFQVHRERPSLSHRQRIIDAKTNAPVLTVRRDIGKLPISYRFDDDSETQVLDLQGNFSVPLQGARATAFFTNATDQTSVQLSMQGSWHNRHATIKNASTGEVLARMESELLNVRNVVGSRRTYKISVTAGVDLAIIAGMIVSLDARSS